MNIQQDQEHAPRDQLNAALEIKKSMHLIMHSFNQMKELSADPSPFSPTQYHEAAQYHQEIGVILKIMNAELFNMEKHFPFVISLFPQDELHRIQGFIESMHLIQQEIAIIEKEFYNDPNKVNN